MSPAGGYLLLFLYGTFMLLITYFFARWKAWRTVEGFLVAERKAPWWLSGPSIAASWIWAGALFVSIQMAYEKGLAGIFWFTFPNVIALGIYVFLGRQIRRKFDLGFTLPEYIYHTLKSERVHKLFLIPFFFGQLIAVTFNAFAGGAIVSFLTGIPLTIIMPILVLITLTYTLISGLEASIVTDFVQLILIILGIIIIVPWAVASAGGMSAVTVGLKGTRGTLNIFDPAIAFSFGIVSSIGLISQTITDQQYWQRVFATKKEDIGKAFLFGAFLFGLVPIGLSLLGFLAANPKLGIVLPSGADPALIGILTVNQLIRFSVAAIYTIIMLSGLTSTIDSAMSATSSLWVTDALQYFRKKRNKNGERLSADAVNCRVIQQSRFAMAGISLAGLFFAYISYFVAGFGIKQLFLISISVAASTSIPTVLSLYWKRLDERGVFWGILTALIIGMPLFIYANYRKNELLVALASLFMITTSTLFCLTMPKKILKT